MNRLKKLLLAYGIDLKVESVKEKGSYYNKAELTLKHKYIFIQHSSTKNGIVVIVESNGVILSKVRLHSAKDVLKMLDQEELEIHYMRYNQYKEKAKKFLEPYRAQRITFKDKQIELIALMLKKEYEELCQKN